MQLDGRSLADLMGAEEVTVSVISHSEDDPKQVIVIEDSGSEDETGIVEDNWQADMAELYSPRPPCVCRLAPTMGQAIEKPPWNLQRAAVYLRKLLADDSPVSLPDISWLKNADRPHAPAAPTVRFPEDEALTAPKPAQRVRVGPGTRAVRGPGEADAGGAAPPAEQERERKLPGGTAIMNRPAAESRPRHGPDGRPKRIKPEDLPVLPAGATLGCSTCRYMKCGCGICRARAGIHWDADVGQYVLTPRES